MGQAGFACAGVCAGVCGHHVHKKVPSAAKSEHLGPFTDRALPAAHGRPLPTWLRLVVRDPNSIIQTSQSSPRVPPRAWSAQLSERGLGPPLRPSAVGTDRLVCLLCLCASDRLPAHGPAIACNRPQFTLISLLKCGLYHAGRGLQVTSGGRPGLAGLQWRRDRRLLFAGHPPLPSLASRARQHKPACMSIENHSPQNC